MTEDLPNRLQQIEQHIAHLEHHVDQMNTILLEQQNVLMRLKKEVQRQTQTLQTMELERIKANITKPPHYQ